MVLVWLLALAQLAVSIQPDGYCNPPYPSWRAQPDYPLKHLTGEYEYNSFDNAVIIRHGDRSPVFKCWPNSPDWKCTLRHQERPLEYVGNRLYTKDYMEGKNVNPGNCRDGQLTEIGLLQQLENGKALKKLYGNFLPKTFDSRSTFVRSTDVPRTFLSGEGLLFGLYPPEGNSCADETITINTRDDDADNMTPNYVSCPMLSTYEKQLQSSPAYQEFNKTIVIPLEDDLFKVFKVPPGYQIVVLFDCIQSHVCHKLPLPEGFTQDLYDRVVKVNMDDYAKQAFYPIPDSNYNWIQVGMASFIGDVMNNINDVATNQTQQLFALFSGHDTTVLPFIMAYNAWEDGLWPAYASLIRIELLKDLIRMYYNDQLLNIPGCGSQTCPYEKFKAISENIARAAQYCHSKTH